MLTDVGGLMSTAVGGPDSLTNSVSTTADGLTSLSSLPLQGLVSQLLAACILAVTDLMIPSTIHPVLLICADDGAEMSFNAGVVGGGAEPCALRR